MLDRIDLQIHVPAVDYDTLKDKESVSKSSAMMRQEIDIAVQAQRKRFETEEHCNAHMSSQEVEEFCQLTDAAEELMKKVFNQMNLSMRGYHKVLKVARTIADLAALKIIDTPHIKEALLYRSLDKYFERK